MMRPLCLISMCFFFFKQKTAYEISLGLVGSEMCIRDRLKQIVRQISRRLTWKVQEDFHAAHGLSCPPRQRAAF